MEPATLHGCPMCLPSLQGTVFQFHSSGFFEAHEAGLALESAETGIQTVFMLCCALTVQVIPKDASGPNKTLTHFLNEQEPFFFIVWVFIQLFIPKFINRFLLMILNQTLLYHRPE